MVLLTAFYYFIRGNLYMIISLFMLIYGIFIQESSIITLIGGIIFIRTLHNNIEKRSLSILNDLPINSTFHIRPHRGILPVTDNPKSNAELTIHVLNVIKDIVDDDQLPEIFLLYLHTHDNTGMYIIWSWLTFTLTYVYAIKFRYIKSMKDEFSLSVFRHETGYMLTYNTHSTIGNTLYPTTLDELKSEISNLIYMPKEMKKSVSMIKSARKHCV